MISTHTIIVGASAAGLASAACLIKKDLPFIILEKSSQIGISWRNHYDRLHLHTSKKGSALPFMNFDAEVPTYPSKKDVVNYLVKYAEELRIQPIFNSEVQSIKRQEDQWITMTSTENYASRFVIIATGRNHTPRLPSFPGLETFKGTVLHSSKYKNGSDFNGKKVLIIGFGNSGCEQAICLQEHGAFPALSVRSPVNVIPRDIFGLPALEIGKPTSRLPPRLRDKLNAPLLRLLVGDITKLGLVKSKYGPLEQIEKLNKIPLLDIGTIKLIREGKIKVFPDILRIQENTVFFTDKRQQDFDALIIATGYIPNIDRLLDLGNDRLADLTKDTNKQTLFGNDGLYFCGFYISPTGMLNEIRKEAIKISDDIRKKSAMDVLV